MTLKSPYLLSLPSLLAISFTALAQNNPIDQNNDDTLNDVERIIVSADLSARELGQLPSSNIVIGDDVMAMKEARHLQDILSVAPNINFSAGASRGKFVQIRGIGERSQFSEPINPSVGLFIDDIDISGLGSLATLYDLQQVEVLMGPRSVASGVNSLGGVIKLLSQDANTEAAGRLSASIGQNGLYTLGGAYGNQINESLSMRVSAQKHQEDGFVYNAFLDADDTNNIDESTATLFLSNQFNEQQSLDLKLYYFDIDNGYDAFSLDNDNVTQSDQPGFDKAEAHAASVKYEAKGQAFDTSATLSYLSGDFDYGYDEDWTFPAFHPFSYSSFDRYLRKVERHSVELRISDQAKQQSNWLAGFRYQSADEALLREYTFNAGDFTSQYTPISASVFGQYEFELARATQLTLAARVENFKADYEDSASFSESIDDTLVAASVSLDHQLETVLLYSSISRGYKAGGFNFDQRLTGDSRTFSPEYNWNVELGMKGDFFSGDGRYQLSVFHMRRRDAQVSDFAVFENELEDGSVVTSFADAILNTDTGINQGVELSTSLQLRSDWLVQANIGYLDATFGDYTRANGEFVEEQDQAQAPDFTLYLSSQLDFADNWRWFIDLDAKDDFRFSDGHNERAPFTLVINTHISWQQNAHLISVWVKNLGDRQVFTRGFGGFSNDPRDEYAFDEPYFQFGQERQLGLSYEYSF